MSAIFHITKSDQWLAAQAAGEYRASSMDEVGFIHFSTADQAAQVANSFYSGQTGLVLLAVDVDRLTAELRWEPPAHPAPNPAHVSTGELFPHLYGALNLDAVIRVIGFAPGVNGKFIFPMEYMDLVK